MQNDPVNLVDPFGLFTIPHQIEGGGGGDAVHLFYRGGGSSFGSGGPRCTADGVDIPCGMVPGMLSSGAGALCPGNNCNGVRLVDGAGGGTFERWIPSVTTWSMGSAGALMKRETGYWKSVGDAENGWDNLGWDNLGWGGQNGNRGGGPFTNRTTAQAEQQHDACVAAARSSKNAAMVGSVTEIVTGGVLFVATGYAFGTATAALSGEVAENFAASRIGSALVGGLDVARAGAMTMVATGGGIGLMADGSVSRLNALNQYDRDLAACNLQSGYQYVTLPHWWE